ncbi:uncharacterized protein LOC117513334 [Thalassophryne amazonica]|uniref:uncharacterized protein LOC117513334 n=1 Tax=Thalassophryne amazonica TaxID=390379 RepID=UPI0014715BB7|nr:uncharacterized protein LOC117513334 [Thalassophryne amazonica]
MNHNLRTMKKTFICDDSMIITIPIGSLKYAPEGQLMPDAFQCVFRDSYKVFVNKGKPKPLGAAQAFTGVFILTLGLGFIEARDPTWYYCVLLSVLFVVSGVVSYAAGCFPNIHLTKFSFALNIISFLWSATASCFGSWLLHEYTVLKQVTKGVNGMITSLLVVESMITLFLIYWLSKAVCKQQFNTLPIILLKQGV